MGDMVDAREPRPRMIEAACRIRRHEIDVVDGMLAIAVDQVDQTAPNAFDCRNIQLHRSDRVVKRLGAAREELPVSCASILDAKRHRACARTVSLAEARAVAAGLGVDDEIRVTLAVQRHLFGTMTADRAKSHALEQTVQLADIGARIFDELEAVSANRIGPKFHGFSPPLAQDSFICNYI